MAKTKISEYDATAANNTDVNSINIAEGCAPSGINNAIRQVMADLKDFQQGTKGDAFLGPVTPSTLTLTGLTANRILYTNGSKQVSTSDNVQFDGTTATINSLATTTLSTSGVATFDAGSAGAPSITFAGDTNTGIYSPTADTIAFTEGGVESMRINSAGYVGIGTNNPISRLHISGTGAEVRNQGDSNYYSLFKTDGTAVGYWQGAADGSIGLGSYAGNLAIISIAEFPLIFSTNNTERMRLDSSGNLGIGNNSPVARLQVAGTVKIGTGANTNGQTLMVNNPSGTAAGIQLFQDGNESWVISNPASTTSLTFAASGNERMRLTNDGKLLVGTTASTSGASRLAVLDGGVSTVGIEAFANSGSFAGNIYIAYANRNTTNGSFNAYTYFNAGAGTTRFIVADSGSCFNSTGTYGSFSDIKIKENIVDASPKLDKLNQVRIVNYNLIGDETKQLGVIAQELEQIFPGMVNETIDRNKEGKDLGTKTKSVKYSVFVPMLIKAIQELNAKVTSLEAQLGAK
jgi:hypothetical protein